MVAFNQCSYTLSGKAPFLHLFSGSNYSNVAERYISMSLSLLLSSASCAQTGIVRVTFVFDSMVLAQNEKVSHEISGTTCVQPPPANFP